VVAGRAADLLPQRLARHARAGRAGHARPRPPRPPQRRPARPGRVDPPHGRGAGSCPPSARRARHRCRRGPGALPANRGGSRTDTRLLAAILVALLGLCVLGLRRLAHQARRREHAATHDALTGLPNRTLFRDRTDQAIRLAHRELTPAALLLLDLDRFKEVNDTLDHHYGDQLLIQVGQRLPAALRNVDTVARLGGDEFAVLLPRIATAEGAVTVAKKLLAAFEEPFLLEGLSLDVEASIGVAIYPEHANDPDELLQRADIAMNVAKDTHAGFVLFDPRQDQHSPRRLALLGELRRAIEHEQLLLHYQPKVDAHTSQVLGVEALVRWQHPNPRPDRARRVHPPGRTHRAHRTAHPLRPGRGVAPMPRLAAGRP
jgi:diguanylate cyclase (GGDEF)-like protein